MEDIELLVPHFLEKFGSATGVREFAPEAMAALRAYHWPGNVRQLRNVVERACALVHGAAIRVDDLPIEVREPANEVAGFDDGSVEGTFQEMKARKIAAIENSYVEALLKKHRGNVTHCAEDAGMTRSAFQKLMQRYGIRSSEFRE
jgi:DNA-binding NtrC family response regulator